jgi:hypothetical protein
MANKLGLTRDQLASFLKDPEQIKQFEQLFRTVDTTTTIILPAIDTDAGIGESQAQEALGNIVALSRDTAAQIGSIQGEIEEITSELRRVDVDVQSLGLKYDDTLAARVEQLQSTIDGLSSIAMVETQPKRRRLGTFYDTTTQTAAAINTAYAATFNTTALSDGVYIGSPTSRIYVDTEATYNFQFSMQLDNTSGGNHLAFLWYRINGTDVANSASQIRLKGSDGELVAAWNFVERLKADDYFELMWSVNDTAVEMTASAAVAPVPGIPSVLLSVVTCD